MRPSSKLRLPWVSLKWHEAIEDNLVRQIQACQQARIAEIKTVKSLCRDLDEAQEALRETQAQRDNLISGVKVQHARADLSEQARIEAEKARKTAEAERDDLASRLSETDERARRVAQERNDLAAQLAELRAEREALLDSMLENVDTLRDRLLDLRADDPAGIQEAV